MASALTGDRCPHAAASHRVRGPRRPPSFRSPCAARWRRGRPLARPPRCSSFPRPGHCRCRTSVGRRTSRSVETPIVSGTMVNIPASKGRKHPVKPVLDQRTAASPVQQHRTEEAAHDEEQRHPKAVDGREDDSESGILPTIRDHPVRREEREGSVQHDPQQHGAGPQGVQVGSSGQSWVLGAHKRRSPDRPRY